ncbi:MAG TPA: arginine--tRNA ligase [Desulfuromonadales bacterium]|nr:arginine--tRNA ligase [Desulfuromonadales bacterium]
MKERLRQSIQAALQSCFDSGRLDSGLLPEIQVEVPGNPQHGDFSTNVAMLMARTEKKPPRKIAEILVAAFDAESDFWQKIEIAGPGFINFTLTPACWYQVIDQVAAEGTCFGRTDIGRRRRVQVEFVSANPTGPLHIGHGRGAATGDAVAATLEAVGYDVQREYYINDAGNQIDTLGRSLLLRYRQLLGAELEFPEDCYQGDYITDLAREVLEQEGERFRDMAEEEAIAWFGDFGGRRILTGIDDDLRIFGVNMDHWFSEKSLFESGEVKRELSKLAENHLSYEKDGAIWFRTTDFGDDKDRVLVRSNGETTYFASDVAYHMEKLSRGFDTIIDVWGADHHGYVPRMKAVFTGLGHATDTLQIILVQLVNLMRGGEQVAMSTRSGEFVTLREVIDEVGRDACRFFFLMRRSDSQLDFDLDLAKQKNTDNPVYYVQYAHARICSINRNAAEQGLKIPEAGEADLTRLTLEEELALAKLLARYPEVLLGAARHYEPHRVIFYLQELAGRFHSYYNREKVLIEDAATSWARLALVNAVKTVIANGLQLVGISAPERM